MKTTLAAPTRALPKSASKDTQATKSPVVSCVRNATDVTTQDYAAKEIIDSIREDNFFKLRRRVEAIRQKFASVMASSGKDRKAAKEAIAEDKRKLPGVMWSGRYGKRSKSGLLQHSGLLCADLDELGDRIAEVRAKLIKSSHLWALFLSPTGDGLKCIFRVPADASRHEASFRAVEQHVRSLAAAQLDQACKDVSRLCFLSHDPDVFCNEEATELPLLEQTESSERIASVSTRDPAIKIRREIATELLGDINWSTETRGYCTCPGQSQHTTGDKDEDCEVHVDGAPTLYCFHDHCSGVVKIRNRELRSRIAKAEQPLIALPDPIDSVDLINSDLREPPDVVYGILHQGSKMVIGGGSKSFKTWSLLDLAISVSIGAKWWGFETNRGRVLYMNFEIQDAFFRCRLRDVCLAKESRLEKGQLSYWGLRGKAADLRKLMPAIIAKLKHGGYSLIIFDPIYKGLGDRDENKAGDIASLLNEIEALAVETGAAVAFGHHFSKGNQAGKESIDRIGGSGVFARDPDTILTMTRHTEDDAFVIDAVLRNHAPTEPFVVRRAHPLMVRDDSLNPKDLKKAGASLQKYSDEDILEPLKRGGMTTTEWLRDLSLGLGLSASGFYVRRDKLEESGLIGKEGKKWVRILK